MAARSSDRFHVLFQQRDERKEELAVEAIPIEPLGRRVGGGNDNDLAREQGLEQPGEDHRIRNIGDRKLIEAEQPRLGRDLGRHEGNGIAVRGCPPPLDPFVHLAHELMEMQTALGRKRRRLMEEVHQHGFAAPNPAMTDRDHAAEASWS